MKEILREVGMIARIFESIANIEFKEYALSKNQYMYLVRIAEQPGIILERICDQIKVDRSTASRAVKKLYDAGFIRKVDVSGTGKKIQLYPTEKGKRIYKMLEADEAYSNFMALRGFDQNELMVLLDYLERIRRNIEPDWEKVKKGGKRPYKKVTLGPTGEIVEDELIIVPFQESHIDDIKKISYAWLKQYDLLEAEDQKILNNLKSEIIENGGRILVATKKGNVVGTISLVHNSDQEYEVAKLGVSQEYRGESIGQRLLMACIEEAKTLTAKQLVLYTNRKLTHALDLYLKLGFKIVEEEGGHYELADLKMILDL